MGSSKASEISIVKEGWKINNFKKPGNTVDLSFVQTPDGDDAVRMDFKADSVVNVHNSEIFKKQRENWPEKISALGMYVWGDGTPATLVISFIVSEGKQYNIHFPLLHKGWKWCVFDVKQLVDFKKDGAKINPRLINNMLIRMSKKYTARVAVGPMVWFPEGVRVDRVNESEYAAALYAGVKPKFDGDIDNDPAWEKAKSYSIERQVRSFDPAVSGTTFKLLYDKEALYVAVKCPIPAGAKVRAEKTERDAALWAEEDVEILLYKNTDPRMCYQLLANPLGTKADVCRIFDQIEDQIVVKHTNWRSDDWDVKVKKRKDCWTAEFKVDWKMMGIDSVPEIFNFQVLRSNSTRKGKGNFYEIWSPVRLKPYDGFGIVKPLAADSSGGDLGIIDEVDIIRLAPGKLWTYFRLPEKIKNSGKKIELTAILNDTFDVANIFKKTISADEAKKPQEWLLEYKGAVTGFHRLVLCAKEEGKTFADAVALVRFRQDLPSTVKFDEAVLVPEPKIIKWGKGQYSLNVKDSISIPDNASERTRKTAEFLAEKFYGYFGIKPEIKRGGKGNIQLSVMPDKVGNRNPDTLSDSYKLTINDNGIEIIGGGERGVYYGVVTLMQIARSKKTPGYPIKYVSIEDWPLHKWRIWHEWIHGGMGAPGSFMLYDFDRLKYMIEKYAAGSKYNMVVLQVHDGYKFKSYPQYQMKSGFGAEEFRDLCDFAREHMLEVVPGMHFGSHSWIPVIDKQWHEKGMGRQQMDVTLPGVYEMAEKMYTELVEAAGKPVHYFHTNNDEWWRPTGKLEMIVNGKTRQQIFKEHILNQRRIINKLGLRMIMLDDMLEVRHAGGPPMNLSEVTKELPRDIIMSSWSADTKSFHKMGFETWQENNSSPAVGRDPGKHIKGYGTLVYRFLHSTFNILNDTKAWVYGYTSSIHAAEFAWSRTDKMSVSHEPWTINFMHNLVGTYSMQDNPAAGSDLIPVPLGKGKTPDSIRKIAGIPTEFALIEVNKEKSEKLNIGKGLKVSSLVMLHQVKFEDTAQRSAAKKLSKAYYHGLPVGKYIFKYNDGSSEELLLRLGVNIVDNISPTLNKFVMDARAIVDLENEGVAAQYEWVNPYPDKIIKEIEVQVLRENIPIVLRGITGRSVRK